jgi:hypothetical protein
MLRDVPHLLAQASRSTDTAARKAALNKLWEIRDSLEADLRDTIAGMERGINRLAEVAALRSAVSTLRVEMALISADRPTVPS